MRCNFFFFKLCLLGVNLGVKEDSSSVVSSPDLPAVYLHLPYTGYTCFLFKLKEERDNFLSALESCIRHCNLGKTYTSLFTTKLVISIHSEPVPTEEIPNVA